MKEESAAILGPSLWKTAQSLGAMVGEGYKAGLIGHSKPWIEQLTKALESRGFLVVSLNVGETFIEDVFVARLDFLIFPPSLTPHGQLAIDLSTKDPRTFPIPKLRCDIESLDRLLTQVSSQLRQRDEQGESMVRRWLQKQQMEEFEELVLDNLKKRFTKQIGALLRAVCEDDLDEIKTRAHTIKGWTGSLKMDEIFQIVLAMETASKPANPDRLLLRQQACQLSQLLYRIPAAYLPRETSPVSTDRQPVSPKTNRTTSNGPPKTPRHGSTTLRILLVDDDSISRVLVGRLLACIIHQTGICEWAALFKLLKLLPKVTST